MSRPALLKPLTVPRQRGVAALTVVMVLFFVMALVAAYTNRNLIFEQRISANNYRGVRALNAADGAVDWTLAMLNGGRIDINCLPSTHPANSDFRRRYLSDSSVQPDGSEGGYEPVWVDGSAKLYPACVVSRNGVDRPVQSCICPSRVATTLSNPALPVPDTRHPAFTIATNGVVGSAFRISLLRFDAGVLPGTVGFVARGCASLGIGNNACFSQTGDNPVVDAQAAALTSVGLVPALRRPQGSDEVVTAALTAGTSVTASAGGLLAKDARGAAVRSGATITGVSATPAPVQNDAALSNLSAASNDAWFKTLFGMDKTSYRRQPATIVLNCAAGCASADLNSTLAGFPRNPIWVEGNLTIDAPTTTPLGGMPTTPPLGGMPPSQDPLLLIVNGVLTISANPPIVGFVYASSIVLTAAAGSATTMPPLLTGAMVSAGPFSSATTGTSPATLVYNADVLKYISLRYGSFVRVPGSWDLTVDFN